MAFFDLTDNNLKSHLDLLCIRFERTDLKALVQCCYWNNLRVKKTRPLVACLLYHFHLCPCVFLWRKRQTAVFPSWGKGLCFQLSVWKATRLNVIVWPCSLLSHVFVLRSVGQSAASAFSMWKSLRRLCLVVKTSRCSTEELQSSWDKRRELLFALTSAKNAWKEEPLRVAVEKRYRKELWR